MPSSEQVTQALRGEPLAVAERRDGWASVTTAYGYPGWVAADALTEEPAGEWLPPAATAIRSTRRAPISARRTSGAA